MVTSPSESSRIELGMGVSIPNIKVAGDRQNSFSAKNQLKQIEKIREGKIQEISVHNPRVKPPKFKTLNLGSSPMGTLDSKRNMFTETRASGFGVTTSQFGGSNMMSLPTLHP